MTPLLESLLSIRNQLTPEARQTNPKLNLILDMTLIAIPAVLEAAANGNARCREAAGIILAKMDKLKQT